MVYTCNVKGLEGVEKIKIKITTDHQGLGA